MLHLELSVREISLHIRQGRNPPCPLTACLNSHIIPLGYFARVSTESTLLIHANSNKVVHEGSLSREMTALIHQLDDFLSWINASRFKLDIIAMRSKLLNYLGEDTVIHIDVDI